MDTTIAEQGVEALRERVSELQEEVRALRDNSDQALRARVAELAALQRVSNAANSALHLNETLKLTVETVAEVMQADVCSIYLYEPTEDVLILRATRGLNPNAVNTVRVRIGEGITGWAAQAGQPVVVSEARTDPRFRYNAALGEEAFTSMLSIPIILFTASRLIGVLNLQTVQLKGFSEDEVRFLETVAGQIAIAIGNAQAYEHTDQALQRKVEELTTLQRVSRTVTSELEIKRVLDLIVGQAVALSKTDSAAIYEMREEAGELLLIASHGIGWDGAQGLRVGIGEAPVAEAVRTRRPVLVQDLQADPQWERLDPLAAREGFRAMFCLPLSVHDRTRGGLVVYSRAVRHFSEDAVGLLTTFADEAAIALDNASLFEEAQRSLTTKSALLKEMHHRVKNNLQTVASLLSLQARRTKDAEVAQPLKESVQRIHSIAAVHDLLSREQFGVVSTGQLARQIIEIAEVYPARPSIRLRFAVTGEDIMLGSKEATICAMALNELMSNAISHGLVDREDGTIRIHASERAGRVEIAISDDGVGLPEGFDPNHSAGLGIDIVRQLVETELQWRSE